MALQSLILPILSVFRSAGLQQASGVLRGLSKDFDSLGSKIGLAAGSFGAFSALTSARQFTVDSVNAANLFQRNLLGLNQVFEELQPRIVAFTKEVEDYGLSQSQAAQASVFLGSVLKQYGFSVSESAGQTERLVTLAQDLATTYGYDVQEALLAITALFRGEYDPIEKFGVAMKQNEVNARLAAQGLNDLEGAELANAQATARLEMLFERANDAVGAFGRATDTLYGSQQRLNAVMGNLQLAFGEPLQAPLAEINNLFADLAQEYAPDLAQIAESLAGVINTLTPTIINLGEAGLEIVAMFQQVIDILTFLAEVPLMALNLALEGLNGILGVTNSLLDAGTALFELWGVAIRRAADSEMDKFLESLNINFENENSIESYIRRLDELAASMRAANGDIDTFDGGVKAASVALRRGAYDARETAKNARDLEGALRGAADTTKDATGNLTGLAKVFYDIDEAIAQSAAKQELEDLGLSAGLIEQILTRPNWKAIFQDIATYARLAAIEVSSIFDRTGESIRFIAELENQKGTLLERINKAFAAASKNTGSTKKTAKESVKDFFDTMAEEIRKQTAREQLRLKGASEGLIDAILGSQVWEKLVARINSSKTALQDLQKQFNQTTAGVTELKAAEDKYLADKARYDDEVKRINDRLQDELQGIREQAEAAKLAMSDLLEGFVILDTIEREVGRFETQIVQMLASVESSLRSAFRNKDILEEGYNALRQFAQAELKELQTIGRQRDEFAKRYDLAKELIDNYKRAFTAAMSLTSLFGNLKDETEKRTVTVVTSGIVKLGASLREFGVTITRSFEEPIAKIQDKSQALVDQFRTMAQKARDFGKNLRELQKMGLNDALFNELVQAGVVAGGETAQALVDGGSATIEEINSLFGEINAIGADLGEEVATSLYGSGVNMMDGLLAGIRSKQEELEAEAKALAEAFNKAFQSKFNIEVGIAQSAAEKAARDKAQAEIDAIPVPQAPVVPNAALTALDAMIANANKFIGTAKQATNAMGAIAKREIFEDLRAAIAGGAEIDISGIRPGMTSADIVKAVQPQAPNIVNNAFYIQPGNRANQNATVESLKQFINQNGNLVGYGIQ